MVVKRTVHRMAYRRTKGWPKIWNSMASAPVTRAAALNGGLTLGVLLAVFSAERASNISANAAALLVNRWPTKSTFLNG